MKKIKMMPKIKLLMTGILVTIIILLSIQGIKESMNTSIEQQEKIKYEYTTGTDINYAVNMAPNILYDTEKLYEDETYISEFIKDINVNFKLYFEGSQTSTIDGKYHIAAQLAGYTTQKEAKQDIWTKNFELVPETAFNESDKCELQRLVVIDYHKYNNLALAIVEASKVNVPVELRIKIQGEMNVETPYEPITKPIESTLVIPLSNPYFQIEKLGTEQTTDAIKETIDVPLQPDSQIIRRSIVGVVLCVVVLILLWCLTTAPDATDIRKKEIDKILKSHSSRLVAVDTIIESDTQENYEVKSIDDLVKIADELEKPILYQYNRNIMKINVFYVMDKTLKYTYRIMDQPMKLEVPQPTICEIRESTTEESF